MADLVNSQYVLLGDESQANPGGILNANPPNTAYGLLTRDVRDEDLSRTFKCYYTPSEISSNATEALISLTPTSGFVTGSAATAFTVAAGVTFRPQLLILGGRIATATSPPNYAVARLRAVPSGSVSATSPLIGAVGVRLRNVTAPGIGAVDAFRFLEGTADIPAGGQFGISFDTASGVAARTVWSVCLVGYEL